MFRARLRAVLIGAALAGTSAFAAEPAATPQDAFQTFRELCNAGQLDSEAGKAIRVREMADMPGAGCELPDANTYLFIDDTHAVARITASFPEVGETDAYFYIDASNEGWRIAAARGFALTGVPRAALKSLQEKPKRTPEEEVKLRNLTLTLASDQQLHVWQAGNVGSLDRLAADVNDTNLAKSLGVGVAYKDSNGTIFVEIGGMTDNVVGFLKPGPSGPPKMTPSDYIWVEPLEGGWFLYRTT